MLSNIITAVHKKPLPSSHIGEGKTEALNDEEMAVVARAVITGVDKISNAYNLPAGSG